MNMYHPQIKKELGFPAARCEKGIGNSSKALSQVQRYISVTAPQNRSTQNRDLNYKKRSPAAAEVLVVTKI